MKFVLFLLLLFSTTNSDAQMNIKLEESPSHVGDSVHVCGKVAGIKFFQTTSTSLTFINLGAAYPNQVLTAVIPKEVRSALEKTPEELFENKNICVSGKIELYKGKPQIVINKKEQISVQ